MCGIAGIYSFFSNVSATDIQLMNESQKHRGPNAEGSFVHDNVGLGHRRLSILDLSDNGNQPMTSKCGRYVMVYNGEIYNYREIAAELQEQSDTPIVYSSSSDSEVILEAFAKLGLSFLSKLNGMFAIAIFDKDLNELVLIRDRLGIKPLYYYLDSNEIKFSSELKAIKSVTKLNVNNEVFPLFLNLGFIPAPYSIYENVYKLEPGCYIKVNKTGIVVNQYWSAFKSISNNYISSEKEAIVKLSDLLASSVQYQLKSDVPFGVFLSGGIDSSLITAQASAIANTTVNTFSIGFKEQKYNESLYAQTVAKHLGTCHHEFLVSELDAIELIDSVIAAYDEPFADSSSIPTMLLSKLAKKTVTVTLSGEGGDELFFGYGSHLWAKRLNNPFLLASKPVIKKILKAMPDSRYKRISHLFDFADQQHIQQHIFSQEQYYFSPKEIEALLFKKSGHYNLEIDFSAHRKLTAMEKQALFDMKYYLPDDLLTKVDRASMFYSLETRVPYLDHRIVELALNISPSLKYKNGTSKYILKEILYQYVPKEIFDRPKQGFAIPLAK